MRSLRSIVVALLLACGPAAAQEEIDVKPAMGVAEAWLASIDAGNYGASWEAAAPLLREAMDKIKWETTIESVRAPLGPPVNRKLRRAFYTRVLPGAPEGEYVVIEYDTRFENRTLSTEIVTPMKAGDGTWKVSGYIIR